MLRNCEESFFKHRTRPCLQYQIKRCTAPCVGLIGAAVYQQDVEQVRLFLKGKNQAILKLLAEKMELASACESFEEAAKWRDRIQALQELQESQIIYTQTKVDLDVVAVALEGERFCVTVLSVRVGQILGNRSYFPKVAAGENQQAVLEAFINQFYLRGLGSHRVPAALVLSEACDTGALESVLTEKAGRQVKIVFNPRGIRKRWLSMAQHNAELALSAHVASKKSISRRFEDLRQHLALERQIERIECFDISHSHGEATVASCVVFDQQGAKKAAYRRFNIKGIQAGDDYAAMRQAITRRYGRLLKENQSLPEVVLIDGGKGQLSQAVKVFDELGIGTECLIGVAKGAARKVGLEQLWLVGQAEPLDLPATAPGFLLIQQVRDEAHRFAITGHRGQRDKKRRESTLDDIPGVGAKRRKALLQHFGGLQRIAKAQTEELAKVQGISMALAQEIYARLHNN